MTEANQDWTLSANSRQVGGEHYKSKYQHWDWVCNVGMGYLAAQVCKYLYRWRNKNGKQDIEKALHFLDKLIELAPVMIVYQNTRPLMASWVTEETKRFVETNNIRNIEAAVCFLLAQWSTVKHLTDARELIVGLLAGADNVVGINPAMTTKDPCNHEDRS